MTWNKLQDKIHGMTDAQRAQSAQFHESYDDGAEIFEVDVVFAETNLKDPEGKMRIEKGDPFLA